MVKISVIMPVHNASDYLNKSINSFLKQNIDSIELICVDDGSTDDSLTILRDFTKEYDFIKVIEQEHSGPGIARNSGLSLASGEYIAFLDADDIFLDENALDKMYNTAINNNADMVGANLKWVNLDYSIDKNYDYKNTKFKYFSNETIITPQEYGIPWAFYKNIFKKSFLLDYNIIFPNLSRGQDPIFLAQVLANIKKIPVLPIDLYGYNHSASGGVNIKVNDYDKKKDYINHFIQTFNLLDKNNFKQALSSYKREFVDYINFRQNINDEDIRKIIKEIPDLKKYYDKDDYGYLIIDTVTNPVDDAINEEYSIIKECLFEESMLEESFIDFDRLSEFSKISEKEVKDINNLKSSFKQLKSIEGYTFENKRTLSRNIGKIKKEIKYYINYNNSILTSNSWKITNTLRLLKSKFK